MSLIDTGTNDRKVLVAFGDSISWGKGSSDDMGYRRVLEQLLAQGGRPGMSVLNEGEPGTITEEGAERVFEVLYDDRPAVLLVLYGTNDELKGLPQSILGAEPSTTSGYLRTIVAAARANRTIAVLSTIPPVCEGRTGQRERIVVMNEKIRALGRELGAADPGVLLADAWADFLDAAPPDGCSIIGPGGNHPNDAGYGVLALSFYKALDGVVWYGTTGPAGGMQADRRSPDAGLAAARGLRGANRTPLPGLSR